jgi:ABC-type multidrug transport system fused ATPase/permease subunit
VNGPARRLLKLLRLSRGRLALTILLGLAQAASVIPIALLLRLMFNHAVPSHDRGEILLLGAAMVLLAILTAAIAAAAQRAGSRTARSVIGKLRRELLLRLYAQPMSWHNRSDPGVVQLTVVQHTERLGDVLNQLVSTALPSAVLAAALAVASLMFAPLLTACVVATVPLYFLAARAVGRPARLRYRGWLETHLRFGAAVRVALRRMGLAHAHAAERWEMERHDAALDEVLAQSREYDDAQARHQFAQQAINGIAGVVPLVVGGLAVSSGRLSIGSLLAFYSLALIALRATSAAATGISMAAIGSEALAEVDAITADPPPAPRTGAVLPAVRGEVRFEDVHFAYEETAVLRGVEFLVMPGEHVALMGPTGSGKTTLVSLMLGLLQPQAGTIWFDEHRLDDLDTAALRSSIGVVMQDTVVFPGTIRANITYGRDTVEQAELDRATRRAGLDRFVAELPRGYDHEVGDEGSLISGGERQRVGIARALLGDPALVILDEPTVNLDAHTIERLLATLDEVSCTQIIVTHDPKVAAHADRVIYLRDGRVGQAADAAGELALQ